MVEQLMVDKVEGFLEIKFIRYSSQYYQLG
jgi:hypothetical protein